MGRNSILKIVFIVLVLLSFCQKGFALDDGGGLKFEAHTVPPEKRTGLNLTPAGSSFHLPKGFRMDFDLSLRHEEHNFGYIARIIVNDTLNVDLIANAGWKNAQFSLIRGTKACVELPAIDSIPGFRFGKWIKVSIGLDYKAQTISLDLNGYRKTVSVSLPRMRDVRICFGRNRSEPFANIDVTPMKIRDIRISDDKGKLFCHFPLDRHGKGFVLDVVRGWKAVAENASWEMDSHMKWSLITDFRVEGRLPQITYYCDGGRSGFHVATHSELHDYSLSDNRLEVRKFRSGAPYKSTANSLLYDPAGKELISYSVANPELCRLDMESMEWDAEADDSVYFSRTHHNGILLQDRGIIAVFGGYDEYRYHAALFTHGLDGNAWTASDMSDVIAPRYLASMAYDGDSRLYVLGGYGSGTGLQWESPQNYYDLSYIDMDSLKAAKVWTFDSGEPVVFGNGMVLDRENGRIYTLSFNNDRTDTEIILNSFGLDAPDRKVYAGPIPFVFYDLHSFCTLVHDRQSGRLVSAVVSSPENGVSDIRLYGISYPPLEESVILQAEPVKDVWAWWWIAVVICVAACVLFLCIRSGSKGRKSKGGNAVGKDEPEQDIPFEEPAAQVHEHSGAYVNLLGNFRYVSASGKDETASFSHSLRNIFAYIIITEARFGAGVTSGSIDEVFYDSDDHSVTANKRNVTMSRLRALLRNKGLGDLSHKNGLWSIELAEGVMCDFVELLPLAEEATRGRSLEMPAIERMIMLAQRGLLLANIEEEWCDGIKAWWLMLVSDGVQKLYGHPGVKDNVALKIRLADIMLLNDPLDESAVTDKCRFLYKAGRTGHAKSCFEKFKSLYVKMLGEEPDIDFEKIISL